MAEVFDEYFVGLKKALESCIKPHVLLSGRCSINDLVYEISLLRIYFHLFHCKRGFNIVNRCQYCTRYFVVDVSLLKYIEKKLSFLKADFKDKPLSKIFSENFFFLNVHYAGVAKSIETDVLSYSHANFGALFFDPIVSTFHSIVFTLKFMSVCFLT